MTILYWVLGIWAAGSVAVIVFMRSAAIADRADAPGATVEYLDEYRAKRAGKSGGDAA
jgi:hypothetical protein